MHTKNIQFTIECSKEKVHFLDVNVCKKETRLCTSVYIKPTDCFTYLQYGSFHPRQTKQSIVYSQLLRYKRITSDPQTFVHDANNLGKQFIRRGYPARLVKSAITKVSKKSRENLTQGPKERVNTRVPLVTTYHPQIGNLAKLARKEWSGIKLDSKLSEHMGEVPLLSQRQPPNLRTLLVRSTLPEPSQSRGNKKCGKPRCQICQHLVTESVVQVSPSYRIHPPNHTCDSTNVLYCIMCKKCPGKSYIGETGNRFRTRFNNHKSSITQKRTTLPVAEHFTQPDHSLKDLRVCLFGGDYRTADDRKWAEL